MEITSTWILVKEVNDFSPDEEHGIQPHLETKLENIKWGIAIQSPPIIIHFIQPQDRLK